MLPRCDRIGREHQTRSIEHGAQDDRFPVAKPFCNRAKDRLPDAPGEVLDCDGEGKFGAEPAELARIAKQIMMMMQLPIRMGVNRGARLSMSKRSE